MPNWCMNSLRITGGEKTISAFKKAAEKEYQDGDKKRKNALSLHNFVPMPKELVGTTAPSPKKNEELIKKYGADNWYDWNIKNLGTKWDIDAELNEAKPKALRYLFDSAWSPPIAGIEKVSKLYPTLLFVMNFEEPGMDFAGRVTIKAGKIIDMVDKPCHIY